jgi:hypothetical protein
MGGVEDAIVASKLTLETEAPLYPEEDGIERKENQSYLLDEISPIVAAA